MTLPVSIATLKPTREGRVMDLVEECGFDISDWSNYAGGQAGAAKNPRYCYEWCFVLPGQVVVLNLWHRDMRLEGGQIVQSHNFLKNAQTAAKTNWRTRGHKMYRAVGTAWEEELPVRVIICDGLMRGRRDPEQRPSKVEARMLDPVPWAVTAFDPEHGDVTISRGVTPTGESAGRLRTRGVNPLFPDEQGLPPSRAEGGRRTVVVNGIERDARARRDCIRYYGYSCAVCDMLFSERYGAIGDRFIHVHHLRPFAGGSGVRDTDPTRDLVPVCPNCHAMMHQKSPPISVKTLRRNLREAKRTTRGDSF